MKGAAEAGKEWGTNKSILKVTQGQNGKGVQVYL